MCEPRLGIVIQVRMAALVLIVDPADRARVDPALVQRCSS